MKAKDARDITQCREKELKAIQSKRIIEDVGVRILSAANNREYDVTLYCADEHCDILFSYLNENGYSFDRDEFGKVKISW